VPEGFCLWAFFFIQTAPAHGQGSLGGESFAAKGSLDEIPMAFFNMKDSLFHPYLCRGAA